MFGKFQTRFGTSEEWNALNPILSQGEPGYVIPSGGDDPSGLKIGDGSTPWSELPFISSAGDSYAHLHALPGSTDIDALGSGVYAISSSANAEAMGLPLARPGSLTVNVSSLAFDARTQMFHAQPAAPAPSRVFVRNLVSGTWSEWAELSNAPWPQGTVTAGTDLNTVVTQGVYVMNPPETILNRPIYDSNGAILEVFRNGGAVIQRYTSTRATDQTVWVRRGSGEGTTWFPWTQVDASAAANSGTIADAARRDLLRQRLRARKGGTIGTGGRGVIALRFDDAAGDFATKVLPLLEERSLPFTRVIATDRIGNEAGGEDDTWENIQDYCIRAGGEVWNHGFNHGTANTPSIVDEQVTGALEKFRLNLPRLIVDCFAPPGGQTSGWMGYMPVETIENLTDNYAGQQIMAHHALSSGYLTNTWYHPLDGVMRDGQIFYSSDARDIPFLQTLIHRARDYPAGVTLMWHANNIDSEGYISMADFTTILDYIVSLRDSGDLLVLTVSGMAVADADSDRRQDLLHTHEGASWSENVLFPAARPGIPGSTRELTATVTGTPEATVTSVVDESTKEHTIPAGGTLFLRHPATIPIDVTSIPVSISGGATSDAHLWAV